MAISNGSATGEMPLDELQFENRIQPLMERAYQVAYQVLGDREAALDAAQEAAMAAWQRRGQLRGPSLTSWFLKITLNKARSIRRRRWFSVIRSTSLAEARRGEAGDPLDGSPTGSTWSSPSATCPLPIASRCFCFTRWTCPTPKRPTSWA